MLPDFVEPEEQLYRSVRCDLIFFVDGRWVVSENAFNDPEQKPSVDRAKLRNFDPSQTQFRESDGVVGLVKHEVCQLQIVQKNTNNIVQFIYGIDVIPDPIKDDPEIPDNPTHAKIITDRDMGSKAFRRLKEELASLANKSILLRPTKL